MAPGQKSKKEEIRRFAKKHGLRDDWHEPDEQSVTARIVGTMFDNAFSNAITGRAVVEGFQEIVVIIEKDQGVGGNENRLLINLADLLAIACG